MVMRGISLVLGNAGQHIAFHGRYHLGSCFAGSLVGG
jgi:hypothetical protein